MARPQSKTESSVSWSVRISSGDGAGAEAMVYGSQVTAGSNEDDTIVLPGNLGAARLWMEAQPLGRIRVIANDKSVIINNKTISPDIPTVFITPLLISFGTLELEVSRITSESHSLLNRVFTGQPSSFIIPLLVLGLLGAVGYVVWQSTLYVPSQGADKIQASGGSLLPQANANKKATSGPLALVSDQLMTMGLSDAIAATEDGDSINLTGQVTEDELSVWSDLEPGLRLLAAPKRLVANVAVTPNVIEKQITVSDRSLPSRPVRGPSLSGDIAAIDFLQNQLVLQNGSSVKLGGELSDGWRLLGLGTEGISIEKDGDTITVPLGALSQ